MAQLQGLVMALCLLSVFLIDRSCSAVPYRHRHNGHDHRRTERPLDEEEGNYDDIEGSGHEFIDIDNPVDPEESTQPEQWEIKETHRRRLSPHQCCDKGRDVAQIGLPCDASTYSDEVKKQRLISRPIVAQQEGITMFIESLGKCGTQGRVHEHKFNSCCQSMLNQILREERQRSRHQEARIHHLNLMPVH